MNVCAKLVASAALVGLLACAYWSLDETGAVVFHTNSRFAAAFVPGYATAERVRPVVSIRGNPLR